MLSVIKTKKFAYQSGILTAFFILFSVFSVQATSITFSNLDLTQQKISIYYPNGTFIEEIYTNETFTMLDNTLDYIMVVKPNKWITASNPKTLIDMILDFIGLIFMVVVAVGVALIILGAIFTGINAVKRGAFR